MAQGLSVLGEGEEGKIKGVLRDLRRLRDRLFGWLPGWMRLRSPRAVALVLLLSASGLANATESPSDTDFTRLLHVSAENFTPITVPDNIFWKKRPELSEKLRDEREILVSVTHTKEAGGARLDMKGVGWVRAPAAFAYRTAQDFARFKEVSPHFRQVQYAPMTRRLFVQMEAMGWVVSLLQQMQFAEDKGIARISWLVVAGAFKGMKGSIEIRKISEQQCEMALIAHYAASELPVPPAILNVGLEFVLKHVASSMRKYLEERYKQEVARSSN